MKIKKELDGGAEASVCCQSCGAVYDAGLAKCPYCGAVNPAGAEKEYMDKLRGIREEMHGLHQTGTKEVKRELKETGSIIKKALTVTIVLVLFGMICVKIANSRDAKANTADYLWEKEAFPVMDEYYAQGDYEAMYDMYQDALEQGKPVYGWEHSGLCEMMEIMKEADGLLELEKSGGLDDFWLEELLWCELSLKWSAYREYPKEDQIWIEERSTPYLEDLAERFPMTDDEEAVFRDCAETNYGYMKRELCEQYIKDHPEIWL